MQFFGSPLTVNCEKSLKSKSIQRLLCVDKNGLVRPHHCLIANDTLTIEYCEDYEGRCERKGKKVSFKKVFHRNEYSQNSRETPL